MSAPATHWTDAARARHFIIPDDAELPPGEFALRTPGGRERSVDEAAVPPYEVTEEEALSWAKEQLTAVFGEMRQQTLGFVEQLRQKTAEMREENRRTWEQAVADAPPEVREAGSHLRDLLKDLAATLRQAAREHGAGSAAPESGDAPSSSAPPPTDPATSAAASTPPESGDAPSSSAPPTPSGSPSVADGSTTSAPGDPASTTTATASATVWRPLSGPAGTATSGSANPPPAAGSTPAPGDPSSAAAESSPDADAPPAAKPDAEP